MRNVSAFVLLISLVTAGCSSHDSAATHGEDMDMMAHEISPAAHVSSPVQSISLPHDEAFAPPGPGRDAFVSACIVCHTNRYITSQPPFTRAVWKGIVDKMIHNYGAHVTEAQAAQIVDYLVATNGGNSIGGESE